MRWRDLVFAGQVAEKVSAWVMVRIIDALALDGTYHVLIGGHVLRACSAWGVDLLLAEFTVLDGGFVAGRKVGVA